MRFDIQTGACFPHDQPESTVTLGGWCGQESCQRLVQLALDRGAEDNVTVVIGRLKNRPPSA
jgi:hypothetical protein